MIKLCTIFLLLFLLTAFVIMIRHEPLDPDSQSFPGQCDLVHSLPNLTLPFGYNQDYSQLGHYSGYLQSSASLNNLSMHYWFFRSRANEWQTRPLVLWLGGWVSTLNGALTGISPIRMNSNGTLTLNEHSWNARANLLFIESLVQVGYFHIDYYKLGFINDTIFGQLTFDIIEKFYQKFPQISNNEFYIAGEGYTSLRIGVLAKEMVDRKFPENFKGVIIGNGVFNISEVVNAHFEYAFKMKAPNILYPPAHWDNFTKFCCSNNKYCSNWARENPDSCTFEHCEAFTNQKLMESIEIDSPIGEPQILESLSECHKFYNEYYRTLHKSYWGESVPQDLHNVNEKCEVYGVRNTTCKRYIVTKHIFDWFNSASSAPRVREALHIEQNRPKFWIPGTYFQNTMCRIYMGYPTLHGHLLYLLRNNIRVLLYTGELDGIISKYNTEWLLNDLQLNSIEYDDEQDGDQWIVEGKRAGYREHYCGGLTRYGIYDAGHTVAEDTPALAVKMIEEYLFDNHHHPDCPQMVPSTKYSTAPLRPPIQDGFCMYGIRALYRYLMRISDPDQYVD